VLRAVLLLALVLPACRSRIQPERETEIYGGAGVSGLPNVGGHVIAGQFFSKRYEKSDFAFELRTAYQGGEDSATQDGEFFQVQAGVKQVLAPGHPRYWYVRYGVVWFRANGDPAILDLPGDYLGGFAGAGYQWRIGERASIGPEATLNFVDGEGSTDFEFLPQVAFNLIFDF